ncbi:biotin--[acetyl-CoA-carboxylase] ligase [Terriglobus sp.]|uniref:biotin--[acetyl-CoA-carboxylase] ligase n=1 Tax=Terriglobus sp. TaxID=1889013 RepID=UPI003B00C664
MCIEGERVGKAAESCGRNSSQPVSFDEASVNAALAGTIFVDKLHHFTSIDSTQTRAIADAQAGAEAGQVYVADEQTAGRGRSGHTWHSEPGSGLYVTVLVRPALRADDALSISLAAGLAAQAAVQDVTGRRIDLRWPNDLVTLGPGSLKLGGILTETAMQPNGYLRYAAIGIGINVNQSAMPAELQDVSTSLRLLTGERSSREDLLIALLQRLETVLNVLAEGPGPVLGRFAENSTWVRGKWVHVAEGEGYTGVTDGLTETGLLRVLCEDGIRRMVRHGGVRELV